MAVNNIEMNVTANPQTVGPATSVMFVKSLKDKTGAVMKFYHVNTVVIKLTEHANVQQLAVGPVNFVKFATVL